MDLDQCVLMDQNLWEKEDNLPPVRMEVLLNVRMEALQRENKEEDAPVEAEFVVMDPPQCLEDKGRGQAVVMVVNQFVLIIWSKDVTK